MRHNACRQSEPRWFLHRVVTHMPPEQRLIIDRARRREPGLAIDRQRLAR
jgi:hypothetical protein